MDDKHAQFLPFNTINEFMLDEYRHKVIQAVIGGMQSLPGQNRSALNNLIKRHVSVPGFRNSALAPAPLKVRGAVTAFERRPEFTAQVLQAWSELNGELRQQVHDLLAARQWEVLPPDADRTHLPGFLTDWPASETYDVLNQMFEETYPDSQASQDDVRLMVVWVGGRLPYNVTGTGDEEEDGSSEE